MSFINIMIDLETTGLRPTSAIMSLAGVVFSPEEEDHICKDEFYHNVNLTSCFLKGLTFDESTSDFWMKQSPEAQSALLRSEYFTIDDTIDDFNEWVLLMKDYHHADDVFLWSQGSDFDMSILRNAAYSCGKSICVSHRNFRDARTFVCGAMNIVSGSVLSTVDAYKALKQDGSVSLVLHNSIDDCKRSALSVSCAWKKMTRTKI